MVLVRRAILAVVVVASLLAGLGQSTLWEPDEPRFAEATRQMFQRGDFITPYFNGVPRFEKPILFYWLQAIAFALFGANEFAARLPSALAGIGTVIILFELGARLMGERAAFVAALVLATTFRFVTYTRQGLTDIAIVFFTVAALFAFLLSAGKPGARVAPLVGWLCVGLGVLTKGPVGILPVLIWGAYVLVARDWSMLSRLRPLAGAVVVAVTVLPWYLLMVAWHGQAFIDFAIGQEMVARVLSEESFAPTRGFLYYFKVWPGDAAPWSVLAIAGAMWCAVRWRELDDRARRTVVFAMTWFFTVFLVFSVSRSKVPHYILPAYPAAALLIGLFVDRLAPRAQDALWWRVPMSAIAVALLGLSALMWIFLATLWPDGDIVVRAVLPAAFLAGGAALVHAIWTGHALRATYIVSGALATAFAVIAAVIAPNVVERYKPMPQLARVAAQLTPPEERVGLVGRYGSSSLIYYSGRNTQWLDDDDAAVSFFRSRERAVCVMPLTDFERLRPQLGHAVRVVASAEEFNIRIERLLEGQRTPGRTWVLIAGQ